MLSLDIALSLLASSGNDFAVVAFESQMAEIGARRDHDRPAPEPTVFSHGVAVVNRFPPCSDECREGKAVEELAVIGMGCSLEGVVRKGGKPKAKN